MTICGTGHRPNKLGGYSADATEKVIAVADTWLRENRPDKVISGMALGWDQALAIAAVRLKIPFIAAVPFKGQESMWPNQSKRVFERLLLKAERVEYICDPGYKPQKMQVRNEWMVNHCDVVLALWDGSSGGTKNCVTYAQKKNKKIINLYERWENIKDIS